MGQPNLKAARPETGKSLPVSHWVHVAIGLAFMFLFPLLPPAEPITEVGMHVLGAFIGMIYLWSAVESIWPSILGLTLIGLSGILPDLLSLPPFLPSMGRLQSPSATPTPILRPSPRMTGSCFRRGPGHAPRQAARRPFTAIR